MDDQSPKRRARPLAWTHHNTKLETSVHDLTTADLNVVFQPIVSMADGSTFAWEALVRCTRAGLESPPELFRRAEVGQGCGRLGRLIREVTFQRGAGRRLFINVHPAELA